MPAGQEHSDNAAPVAGEQWQDDFLVAHKLPADYLVSAQEWFTPMVRAVQLHHLGAGRPVVIGVNGSQGSGKTTLCDYVCARLQAQHGLRTLSLSLDDFYLTAAERQRLAHSVHPLLATRGVPGTHDMALLQSTLDALLDRQGSPGIVRIPRFDKALDDRKPVAAWDEVVDGIDVLLLEGWCLGVSAQEPAALIRPVNSLEAEEDPEGLWRRYVNAVLARDYPPLYQRVDQWLMLQAPSFDCVYRWRLEQEYKLAQRAGNASPGVMSEQQVARFIQYYQRLTERCLADLPERVNYLYQLDVDRRIRACRHRERSSL